MYQNSRYAIGAKRSRFKQYTQLSFKPNAALELTTKRFKMSYITKYDRTSDPRERITTYTMKLERSDLAQHEIESVLL